MRFSLKIMFQTGNNGSEKVCLPYSWTWSLPWARNWTGISSAGESLSHLNINHVHMLAAMTASLPPCVKVTGGVMRTLMPTVLSAFTRIHPQSLSLVLSLSRTSQTTQQTLCGLIRQLQQCVLSTPIWCAPCCPHWSMLSRGGPKVTLPVSHAAWSPLFPRLWIYNEYHPHLRTTQ